MFEGSSSRGIDASCRNSRCATHRLHFGPLPRLACARVRALCACSTCTCAIPVSTRTLAAVADGRGVALESRRLASSAHRPGCTPPTPLPPPSPPPLQRLRRRVSPSPPRRFGHTCGLKSAMQVTAALPYKICLEVVEGKAGARGRGPVGHPTCCVAVYHCRCLARWVRARRTVEAPCVRELDHEGAERLGAMV